MTSPDVEALFAKSVRFARPDELPVFGEEAKASDLCVLEIDGREATTREGLFVSLAESFRFPEYFGHNWDAVEECLGDLSWLRATRFLLVIRHGNAMWDAEPAIARQLTEVWSTVAKSRARDGVRLAMLFIVTNAPVES